jgi:hypothetical protein
MRVKDGKVHSKSKEEKKCPAFPPQSHDDLTFSSTSQSKPFESRNDALSDENLVSESH